MWRACSFDLDNDGICDFESCGLPLTYQGYDYATVEINGRCWFAENLRSENYANSESISSGLDAETWTSTSEGAVATYGETLQTTRLGWMPAMHPSRWKLTDDCTTGMQ